jgi:hypothetical protein
MQQLMIINIRRNLWQFGSVHALRTRIGRKRTVTLLMIRCALRPPVQKAGLYLDSCYPPPTQQDEFRILKVHGSSNSTVQQLRTNTNLG